MKINVSLKKFYEIFFRNSFPMPTLSASSVRFFSRSASYSRCFCCKYSSTDKFKLGSRKVSYQLGASSILSNGNGITLGLGSAPFGFGSPLFLGFFAIFFLGF